MDERFLRNGLLLECPQQIEVRHGHKQQQVVRGRCGGLPPGRHLLVGDARLEDGIGQGKLGRQAGDGRGPPPTAYMPNPASAAERFATVIVPSLFCSGPSWLW